VSEPEVVELASLTDEERAALRHSWVPTVKETGHVPIGDEVPVRLGDRTVHLKLPGVAASLKGDKKAPSFSPPPGGTWGTGSAREPVTDYTPVFSMIERTALEHCRQRVIVVSDREFDELYRHLRRRPDGTHAHPIFSYLRGAVRVALALRDTSRDELEAVLSRLAGSAKHRAVSDSSANYLQMLMEMFMLRRSGPSRPYR
jgi:hypothetical protein